MIRYHVRLPQHSAHRVDVRMTLDDVTEPTVDVSMPVWTPGSYLVREFARNVLDLSASDDAGRGLAVTKVDKNTWRVTTGGASSLHVDYTLYANERSVRTNHVDADHAFLSPAATFLWRDGHLAVPHAVSFELPAGWHAFTAAPADGDGFLLPDYDALVDTPFELGPHVSTEFTLDDVTHRVVMAGRTDLRPDDLAADVKSITREVSEVFGFLPFPSYTFLMEFTDSGGGGLEHKDSSVCMTSAWDVEKPDKYRRFLSLVAHEYFHAWNVKRFRPEALGPFDYDRENYTPDLWVAEGITSYYDDLCTLRAGFADKVDDYLAARADAFRAEAERPGGRRSSLVRSSLDAWIKFYRPDENSANSTVSYYSKGALVSLMLDLRIRRLTDGRASLADALRLGWTRYTERGVGFPPGAMRGLASEVAGSDLSAFFDAYVDGTVELDPDPDLAWVGLRLAVTPQKSERDLPEDDEGFLLAPSLGISVEDSHGLCRVSAVSEDGPAFGAGLNHDDLLLAVDDMRVSASTLQDRLDRTRGPVTLTFFRGQTLRTLAIVPRQVRLAQWRLEPVTGLSEAQREAFRDWTAWEHPGRASASSATSNAADVPAAPDDEAAATAREAADR
ncbi:MAG: M61 family metallopeptidase [Planctomycetes bacterium]|nr:M61 family metallopeptidase [Planctomycetota bacterium]